MFDFKFNRGVTTFCFDQGNAISTEYFVVDTKSSVFRNARTGGATPLMIQISCNYEKLAFVMLPNDCILDTKFALVYINGNEICGLDFDSDLRDFVYFRNLFRDCIVEIGTTQHFCENYHGSGNNSVVFSKNPTSRLSKYLPIDAKLGDEIEMSFDEFSEDFVKRIKSVDPDCKIVKVVQYTKGECPCKIKVKHGDGRFFTNCEVRGVSIEEIYKKFKGEMNYEEN